jgi:hypothetical protein
MVSVLALWRERGSCVEGMVKLCLKFEPANTTRYLSGVIVVLNALSPFIFTVVTLNKIFYNMDMVPILQDSRRARNGEGKTLCFSRTPSGVREVQFQRFFDFVEILVGANGTEGWYSRVRVSHSRFLPTLTPCYCFLRENSLITNRSHCILRGCGKKGREISSFSPIKQGERVVDLLLADAARKGLLRENLEGKYLCESCFAQQKQRI